MLSHRRIWLAHLVMILVRASATAWEGFITVAASSACKYLDHKLWFRVCRPELLHKTDGPAPLVVLHGGPQVPSDYLFDLAPGLDDRAVVFYDQLGCGRSSSPSESLGEVYSVKASLRDLCAILSALKLRRYHLYGQSWGGLLAAELSGRRSSVALPISLTISNSPSSVPLVQAEAERLLQACDGDVPTFMAKHNCRIPEQPEPIAAAYAHAGSSWRGTAAISDLEVSAATMQNVRCPALCLRGEYDFCTDVCVQGWSQLPEVRFATIADASHHTLLEQPESYLAELSAFLREHDDF